MGQHYHKVITSQTFFPLWHIRLKQTSCIRRNILYFTPTSTPVCVIRKQPFGTSLKSGKENQTWATLIQSSALAAASAGKSFYFSESFREAFAQLWGRAAAALRLSEAPHCDCTHSGGRNWQELSKISPNLAWIPAQQRVTLASRAAGWGKCLHSSWKHHTT